MTTNTQSLIKNDDKSFTLRLTIKQPDISAIYDHTLNHLALEVEINGFRKGKAPLDMVKQHISEEKLIEETAQTVISNAYQSEITKNDLKPIIQPKIKILNPPVSINKDWDLEITSCELPEIKIEDSYQPEIIAANVKNKDQKKEEQVNQILELLLQKSQTTLPSILVDSEIEYKLSKLINQVDQAGITIQAYFKNQNTNLEDYKNKLKTQVTKEWTLNLAIDHIAKSQHIEVTPEEVDAEIKKYPNSKTEPGFVSFILLQNKTLEYLLNLA